MQVLGHWLFLLCIVYGLYFSLQFIRVFFSLSISPSSHTNHVIIIVEIKITISILLALHTYHLSFVYFLPIYVYVTTMFLSMIATILIMFVSSFNPGLIKSIPRKNSELRPSVCFLLLISLYFSRCDSGLIDEN